MDTLEIVLDRPLPAGETTRFILDDGQVVNVVEYSFVPLDTGACCGDDGSCQDLTPDGCVLVPGAVYRGHTTSCLGDNSGNEIDDACDDLFIIPAVSQWGVVVMTLIILVVGSGILRRRRTTLT